MASNTMPKQPRRLAICVIWRDGRLLVGCGFDSVKGESFYRPLGGEIEEGEKPEQTAIREIDEELGRAIEIARYLGLLENRFVWEGKPGWELLHVFEARFTEPVEAELTVIDEDWEVAWLKPDEMDGPLYPEGLRELLVASGSGLTRPSPDGPTEP